MTEFNILILPGGKALTRSAGTGGAAGEKARRRDPPRGRVLGAGVPM